MRMTATALAMALTAALGGCSPAHAHSWYSAECCDDRDCAPISDEYVSITAEGYEVVIPPGGHPLATSEVRDLFRYGDPRLRPSQDGDYHGCLIVGEGVFGSATAGGWLRCLYVPMTM